MNENKVPFPDRIKLPLTFSPESLKKDLAVFKPDEWIKHFVQQNYEGDWNVIPLRGPAKATHPVLMIYSDPSCDEFSNTPFLDKVPYIQQVIESFKCPLQAVRLMNLSAGSKIKEHTDFDLSAEDGVIRLHIPITTNDKIVFQLNGTRVIMNEGECWYLRLSDRHSVENNSSLDRVHLVIDAEINPWLQRKLLG